MYKPRMVVVEAAEAEVLLELIDQLEAPSLIRMWNGKAFVYMAVADELRAWREARSTHQSRSESP